VHRVDSAREVAAGRRARRGGSDCLVRWAAAESPPISPKELAPAAGESIVSSGVDKFANTELESFLKGKGVKTVIMVGAAAHGAVLYTASTAVMKGFKVIVPVDGMSADNAYAEQYTAWHFANAPLVSSGVTLTTIDGVKF